MVKGLWKIIALSLAGVLAIVVLVVVGGVIAVLASDKGLIAEDAALLIISAVMAVLMMALSLWLGVAWMARIDEAAREAHKASWFYGGSGGLAVGGVFIILASTPPAARLTLPAWFDGRTDPAAYAATGAVGLMTLMLIGYGVVWGWWWLARR
jgi:hypothetical protein